MRQRSKLMSLVVNLLAPALLMGLGLVLIVVSKTIGPDVLLWVGAAMTAVGIVWAFISCILGGIDPFDL